ncbi:MAG: hypothetical protein V4813_07810 [Gemmatimonadota bacterium]
MLSMLVAACDRPDPAARERVVERDQLRREIAGLRTLEDVAPGKLMDREHEVLVSVSDTLLRSLIAAAFPVTIDIPNKLSVTLTSAVVVFRSNVARVDITGHVRRSTYPHVTAAVTLRGALDGFKVDSNKALRARINIDDVALDTPRGTPATFDPLVINVLQSIVERSLPELTSGLPAVTIPVRLDQSMNLPGFGPEGAFTIQPSIAPMTVRASRVIAFQNRLWIILHIELGAFATVTGSTP